MSKVQIRSGVIFASKMSKVRVRSGAIFASKEIEVRVQPGASFYSVAYYEGYQILEICEYAFK